MPNSTSGPSAVGPPPPSLSISSSAFQSPRLRLIARRLESRLVVGWLDFRSIARSLINVLSNCSRTLDIKIVVPRTRIAIEVPTDRVTGGVDRAFFRLDSRRGQEQPKERRERCQSDDAPDSQIGLLRQFGPLHLIDGLTLVCILPTTALVGSPSDSSTLCLLARRFELPFGIGRFAVRASFRESRLRNRHEDDGEKD